MKDNNIKKAKKLLKSNGKLSQAYLMRKMQINPTEANRLIKEIEILLPV